MLYNHEILLDKGVMAFGKEFFLAYVPECEELAGSGTRKVKECFRVIWKFDGNRHSKAFLNFQEARAYFDAYTKPILEEKEG